MKKRILSILTVMAMLLSMCAVSVYAEDAEITTPVTYNYTYVDDSGSSLETQSNVFGRTGDSYKVSYEANGNKNLKVGNAVGTTTNNVDDKSISSGQKIKVSLKAAGDSWNPENVTLYLGIAAKVETETAALNNYSLKIKNGTGEYIGWGNSLKKTTIDDDKFTEIPIPNKTWVQYDVVFSVYNNHNELSVYANGRPLFEDVVLYGTEEGEVLKPFAAVKKPMMTWYAVNADYAFHLADVSMTIYPANYEGTIIEDYPINLTDSDFKEEFKEEDDGSLTYTGMQALSTSEVSKIVTPDWTAEYLVSDNIGYIKMTKGDTVYYEKAADRVNGFDLTDVDTLAGEKRLSVEVKNVDAEESVSPVLLLASYSGSNLVRVAISDAVTIDAKETGTLTANLMVAAEENVSEIRAFLLDSKGSLIPIKSVISTN